MDRNLSKFVNKPHNSDFLSSVYQSYLIHFLETAMAIKLELMTKMLTGTFNQSTKTCV